MSNENAKTEATPKKSFFKGIKAEFGKIMWPNKDKITKETIAVVVATVVLGAIIAGMDFLIRLGLEAIL